MSTDFCVHHRAWPNRVVAQPNSSVGDEIAGCPRISTPPPHTCWILIREFARAPADTGFRSCRSGCRGVGPARRGPERVRVARALGTLPRRPGLARGELS